MPGPGLNIVVSRKDRITHWTKEWYNTPVFSWYLKSALASLTPKKCEKALTMGFRVGSKTQHLHKSLKGDA